MCNRQALPRLVTQQAKERTQGEAVFGYSCLLYILLQANRFGRSYYSKEYGMIDEIVF